MDEDESEMLQGIEVIMTDNDDSLKEITERQQKEDEVGRGMRETQEGAIRGRMMRAREPKKRSKMDE